MSSDLRKSAERAAKDQGFSSLQDVIRVLLAKLANRQLAITVEDRLSPKAERRYAKMIKDIESGKEPVYEAKTTQDLQDQLYDRKRPVRSSLP